MTSAAEGYRTITFSKHFSNDSACRESRREAPAHWHHKLEHTRGSCAECRSTASADTPMALAEQQAHGHVGTSRPATVLPICAAKRV